VENSTLLGESVREPIRGEEPVYKIVIQVADLTAGAGGKDINGRFNFRAVAILAEEKERSQCTSK
jgi:hypothetical protein